MSDDAMDQVHRDLVNNLGDEEALQKMQGGTLPAEDWGPAIERVRALRFGELPPGDGNRRVGALIGERFLASGEGKLARLSLDALPHEGVFAKLVPMLGERLRQSIRFAWQPSASGGLLRIVGRRSTPAEVTLGFLEAVAESMSPPPRITIASADEELLLLRVDWL